MARARTLTTMLALLATLLLAACAGSGEPGEIEVSDARIPVPAGPNGAAYMTLTNVGDADDRLVGADTDVAETVELHETQTEGGSMRMQQVDGIAIPAGGEAVLEQGGLHVMLLGVDQDLSEGDTVGLTLSFEQADDQDVSVEVVPLGEEPAMDMGSEGTEMESESMETGDDMEGDDTESER